MARPLLILLALVTLPAAAGGPPPEGNINHVVLVWLKEPGHAAHRQRIIEGSRRLRDIPGVMEVTVGAVVPSDRAIVDDSFDVGLVMTFASREAMQAYVDHPAHRRIVKEQFMPVVERILVYDFDTR